MEQKDMPKAWDKIFLHLRRAEEAATLIDDEEKRDAIHEILADVTMWILQLQDE